MKSLLCACGLIALLLNLGSCTIEKRHYRSGYHIDWHLRDHQSPGDQSAGIATDTRSGLVMAEVKDQETDADTLNKASSKTPVFEAAQIDEEEVTASSNDNVLSSFRLPVHDFLPIRPSKQVGAEPTEEHPLADLSLFTGLGAFGAALIYAVIASAVSNDVDGVPVSNLLGLLSLVAAIVAIVSGNKVVRDVRASPGTYTGETKARIGRTLGWVYLLLFILSMIIVLLFVSLLLGSL
ncbi:MAG: hypothetical protein JNM00_07575 [Flavobacteriales bacterium]|nr:hypothetical protein [Flavobacteriales bacterium]